MLSKVKFILLTIFLLPTLTIGFNRALASSSSLWTESPKANSQIIILDQPQLDKWTKVRLRVVALNEDWKGRNVKVSLEAEKGLAVKPSGKDINWWKNIHKGDVFETEFEIMPYMAGRINIDVEFGEMFSVSHLLVLDDSCKVTFNGTWEDLYNIIGQPNNEEPEHRFTPEQSIKYNQILPVLHDVKPTITKEKVIIRKREIRVEITPPPAVGQESKVRIILQSFSKEAGLKVTVGSQLKAELSQVSKWNKINGDKYIVEFSLTPKSVGEDVVDIYFKPEYKSAYVYNFTYTIGENGKLKSVKNSFKSQPTEVQQ